MASTFPSFFSHFSNILEPTDDDDVRAGCERKQSAPLRNCSEESSEKWIADSQCRRRRCCPFRLPVGRHGRERPWQMDHAA